MLFINFNSRHLHSLAHYLVFDGFGRSIGVCLGFVHCYIILYSIYSTVIDTLRLTVHFGSIFTIVVEPRLRVVFVLLVVYQQVLRLLREHFAPPNTIN